MNSEWVFLLHSTVSSTALFIEDILLQRVPEPLYIYIIYLKKQPAESFRGVASNQDEQSSIMQQSGAKTCYI